MRVNHCADAWGFVLRGGAGWKLVFSGDTRPSLRLCQAGAGATLLIHEATFEPAMHAQACCLCTVSAPTGQPNCRQNFAVCKCASMSEHGEANGGSVEY